MIVVVAHLHTFCLDGLGDGVVDVVDGRAGSLDNRQRGPHAALGRCERVAHAHLTAAGVDERNILRHACGAIVGGPVPEGLAASA